MIDQRTNDESDFRQWSPASNEIFAFIESSPELSDMPWGFDSGFIAKEGTRISASFSCGSAGGWGNDKLHINANLENRGSWKISYNVERA